MERAARGQLHEISVDTLNLNSTRPPLKLSPSHIERRETRKDISLKTPHRISGVRTRDTCMTDEAVIELMLSMAWAKKTIIIIVERDSDLNICWHAKYFVAYMAMKACVKYRPYRYIIYFTQT